MITYFTCFVESIFYSTNQKYVLKLRQQSGLLQIKQATLCAGKNHKRKTLREAASAKRGGNPSHRRKPATFPISLPNQSALPQKQIIQEFKRLLCSPIRQTSAAIPARWMWQSRTKRLPCQRPTLTLYYMKSEKFYYKMIETGKSLTTTARDSRD